MADEKIIESFHAMWNNFPGMVRLIQKDRHVVAVNKAAGDAGFKTGVRCFEVGSDKVHAGCLAGKALSEKTGLTQLKDDGKMVRYWIPVDGHEDLFVHFVILTSSFLPSDASAEA